MPIELQHERDNIFRIELTAKLRQAEFQRCQEQILHEVSRLGPVRLLFLLDEFEGWAGAPPASAGAPPAEGLPGRLA